MKDRLTPAEVLVLSLIFGTVQFCALKDEESVE